MEYDSEYGNAHGIVYVVGEATNGQLVKVNKLEGRRIRSLCGSYGRLVTTVDEGQLISISSNDGDDSRKNWELDTMVSCVAFTKSDVIALSSDRSLLSTESTIRPMNFAWTHVKSLGITKAIISQRKCMSEPHALKCTFAVKNLKFKGIAAGACHAAAITHNGELYTWGKNFYGQLGHRLPESNGVPVMHYCAWPRYVQCLHRQAPAVKVSCGDSFTIVLLSTGIVYHFGLHISVTGGVQLANDQYSSNCFIFQENKSDITIYKDIAAGSSHALLLTLAGEISATGLNASGQLGVGIDAVPVAVIGPVRISSNHTWTHVAAGGNTSAAITSSGRVYTWGSNTRGKLGHHFKKKSVCVPGALKLLGQVYISQIACDGSAFAFYAPINISSIYPQAGDILGEYELNIRGSGFYPSSNILVRFLPLEDGRLVRGSLAEYCESSCEIVCKVPPFALPGRYKVQIAYDGRNCTSSSCIFVAYKAPRLRSISMLDSHIASKDCLQLTIQGEIPQTKHEPVLRFTMHSTEHIIDTSDFQYESVGTKMISLIDIQDDVISAIPQASDDCITYSFNVPRNISNLDSNTTYDVSISYNQCVHWIPLQWTDPSDMPKHSVLASPRKPQITFHVHNGFIMHVHPNSFNIECLPQQIRVIINGYNALSEITEARLVHFDEGDGWNISIFISVQSVEDGVLICAIPTFEDWRISKGDVTIDVHTIITELRQKQNTKCFKFNVEILKHRRKLDILAQSFESDIIYLRLGMESVHSIHPSCGPSTGGTLVNIIVPYLNFAANSAIVAIVFDGNRVEIPGRCLLITDEKVECLDASWDSKYTIQFEAPQLSADAIHGDIHGEMENQSTQTDNASFSASYRTADVYISLDGHSYAETSVSFTYYSAPKLTDIAPTEVSAGTIACIQVSLPILSIRSARVRLMRDNQLSSVIVAADANQEKSCIYFKMPLIEDVVEKEKLIVALAIDGQHYVDEKHQGAAQNANEITNGKRSGQSKTDTQARQTKAGSKATVDADARLFVIYTSEQPL